MANRTSVMIGLQRPSSYNQNWSISTAISGGGMSESPPEPDHNVRQIVIGAPQPYIQVGRNILCMGRESVIAECGAAIPVGRDGFGRTICAP